MKTHLFKLNNLSGGIAVGDLLEDVEKMSLVDRNRDIEGHANRIEAIEFLKHDGADCALVNFVKLRMEHGPGRAGLDEATRGFDLDRGEGFAEETAALFDLDHSHVIVEYNHHGARATALKSYIEEIRPNDEVELELLPCLDETVWAQLGRCKTLSKMEIKVAPAKLRPADKTQFPDLLSVVEFAADCDAPSITVTLGGLQGARATLGQQTFDFIKKLVGILRRDELEQVPADKALRTFKVVGKDSDRHPAVELDLIRGKVCGIHEIEAGEDRRFPVADRWEALKKDHVRWSKAIRP